MTCADQTVLPITNATIKAVRPAATADGYRAPAAAPAATWTGEAGVYVDELAELRQRKDDVDRLEPTWMALDAAAEIPFELGDQVTYRLDGADTDTARRVRVIDRFDAIGLIHVTFWDA